MKWNSKKSTYYSKGRKSYSYGDDLPGDVIAQMGTATLDEYISRGLISSGQSAAESEKDALIEKAKGLGLKPHHNAGIAKVKSMIEDHEALEALKAEALKLDIVVRDDVSFEELTKLIENVEKELNALGVDPAVYQALKAEALKLDIVVRDDMSFEELTRVIENVEKELNALPVDPKAYQALRAEALELGIDVGLDVSFEELTALVADVKGLRAMGDDEPDH